MASNVKRISANARAIGSGAQGIAYAIIALVVLYSDIMFVSLMWAAFPGGFLTIAAIGGAFATGISVIALVIGKSHWFRPGGQLVFAWLFTALEVAVSIMNVVVSVMAAKNEPLGYLSVWLTCSPATPIVALVGWIIVLYLDKQRASLHEEMEMEDDLANSEREHKRQVHAARMEVKATALEQQKEYLKQHLASADVQSILSQGSYEIARTIVSEIVQRPIMPQLPAASPAPALPTGRSVEGSVEKTDSQKTRAIKRQAPPKKQLPRLRKFTPSTPAAPAKEVGTTTSPLERETDKLKIKKNTGPYKVNRPAPKLPVND